MAKKIAVLVRDRQEEALRMALGITLMDDAVDVYVLDAKVQPSEANTMNLEGLKGLGTGLYTNHAENTDLELLSTEEIARRLLQYDHVIPY
jgi:hypothetical protein